MKSHCILSVALGLLVAVPAVAQVQDIDKELVAFAERIASPLAQKKVKKVAVLDFVDLQGNPSGELGKYISEQITLNLIMTNRDFTVLDRANLNSVLAEHKLTATGLVNPENAKKLGMFAGVDALVLGTTVQKGNTVSLIARITTTETAAAVGGARGEFNRDEFVRLLESKPAPTPALAQATAAVQLGSPGQTAKTDQGYQAKYSKTFGDLRVTVDSLKVINDQNYRLMVTFVNLAKRSIWVALEHRYAGNQFPPDVSLTGKITDPDGNEFICPADSDWLNGIKTERLSLGEVYEPTEISPGDSVVATIKYGSRERLRAKAGECTLQLNVLAGDRMDRNGQKGLEGKLRTIVTKITAE